jgi:hypothetical protein
MFLFSIKTGSDRAAPSMRPKPDARMETPVEDSLACVFQTPPAFPAGRRGDTL